MKDFIKVMKALSDANRVKMIKLLQRRVLCVCEIQEAMGLAQSTASKHLKILEEARRAVGQLPPCRRGQESVCGQYARQPATLARSG
jgi:predicted transcriptional regulator